MRLVRNPFVQQIQQDSGTVLVNTVNGTTYRLNDMAYAAWFQEPRNLHDGCVLDEADRSLRELIERDLLVLEDLESGAICLRNPTKATLFGARTAGFAGLTGARLAILGVPYAGGHSRSRDAEYGPVALRRSSTRYTLRWADLADDHYLGLDALAWPDAHALLEDWPDTPEASMVDLGDVVVYHSEPQSDTFQRIEAMTEVLVCTGITPFLIGGDHSITYSAVKAVARHHSELHMIQFDAHTDTYTNRFDRALRPGLVNHANFVNHIVQQKLVKRAVQIGVRGLGNVTTSRTHDRCIVIPVGRPIEFGRLPVPGGADVYLTVDVDVLDPNVMPATAHPVPGGLSRETLHRMLSEVFARYNVVGIDLVELCPNLARNGSDIDVCLEIALHLALRAVCLKNVG